MERHADLNSCGRADDIISYMYNEMELADCESFELHLASCTSCTDEFAAVAEARFSVFEWHKEEFLDIPTPAFSIPYGNIAPSSVGIAATLSSIFRGAGWAVPVMAVVTLSVVLGVYLLSTQENNGVAQTGTGQREVAVNSKPEPSIPNDNIKQTAVSEQDKMGDLQPSIANRSKSQQTSVKISASVPSKAKTAKLTKAPAKRLDKPMLSTYKELEDKSLRLSDLLDEVGG